MTTAIFRSISAIVGRQGTSTLLNGRIRALHLGDLSGVAFYAVDGNSVKIAYKMDFVEGGNDMAYPTFIPSHQIWIDSAVERSQWANIAYHEWIERELMSLKKLDYEEAHEIANAAERPTRTGGE